MNPKPFLLDTSAILALIEDEAGAERVETVITNHPTLLHSMTLLELYYITLRERNRQEAERRYILLKSLPTTILWNIDEPLLLSAARIKASYPLSIADSIIAAAALQHNATLLHKDPEYQVLSGMVQMESLQYKPLTK